jgi:hypothetical protein
LVTAWVTKASTVARKVKARLCLVSVRLSGAEIGVSAEARNDATVIFPGKKGIAKAMSDDRIFKLGAKQNKELRETLAATLATVKRPALVLAGGQWFPASIPELDGLGDPTGYQATSIAPAQQLPQVTPEPMDDRARLEAMFRSDAEAWHPSELEEPLNFDALLIGWAYSNGENPAAGDIDTLKSLALYCQKKGEVFTSLIESSWARNNSISRSLARDFLGALLDLKLIENDGDRVVWRGD